MKPQAIIDDLCATLDDVVPKASWGETALFYNPGRTLPNGVYFCTFKERDGEHDRASVLTRDGVFRVSIGVSPATYVERFGPRPARPAKGGAWPSRTSRLSRCWPWWSRCACAEASKRDSRAYAEHRIGRRVNATVGLERTREIRGTSDDSCVCKRLDG